MKIPLVDLTRQHQSLYQELLEAFEGVLNSSAFIKGPYLKEFEETFAALMGASYAVGVGSGTAALQLAFRALEIGPGHEVILPANTFVATAEAVIACGATPVFADVCEHDFQLDWESVKSKITERTQVIAPVHLYGLACDLKPLLNLAAQQGLHIVNDAAQAHLAAYRGKPISTYGDLSCWSFYPGKNLGALGDGGAVTGQNLELCQKVSLFSDHGSPQKYHHVVAGLTERLDGLQAAFLSVKLRYLERWTQQRQKRAAYYDELLKDLDIALPQTFADRSHVYHLYVIRVPHRDNVLDLLQKVGVGAGIHYPKALTQTASMSPWVTEACPVAEKLAQEVLSLPLYPDLTEKQQEYVVEQLKQALKS